MYTKLKNYNDMIYNPYLVFNFESHKGAMN